MTVLDDAISMYRAAAELLNNLSQIRVDLLGAATSSTTQPVTLFEGHRAFGPSLDICVPTGSRATFTVQDRDTGAATIESDLPQWMTLEGWVPPTDTGARHCFVELDLIADEAVTADAFIRVIDPDHAMQDGPVSEVRLNPDGLSVIKLDLPKSARNDRRKVVLHLRRPPTQMDLRQFALIPL